MHSRMSNLQKRIRENISQSQNNRNLNIRLRQAQYTIIFTLGLLQSKCFQSKKYTHSYRTDCNIGRYQTSCGRATLHDIKQHLEEKHCTIPTSCRLSTLHDTKQHMEEHHCTIPKIMWRSNIARYQTSCGRATLHDTKQHMEEQHCTIPNIMWKSNIARYQTSSRRATLHDTKHMLFGIVQCCSST